MKTTLKNKLRSALHLENLLLILIMFCAGCAAPPSSRAESLAADVGTDTNIAFSPDQIDFGFQGLETTSRVHIVTIRNDGQTPLVIEHLSVSAGFSIAENTCPQSPNAIASQGTCTVEVVFMPSSPKKLGRRTPDQLRLNSGRDDAAQRLCVVRNRFADL